MYMFKTLYVSATCYFNTYLYLGNYSTLLKSIKQKKFWHELGTNNSLNETDRGTLKRIKVVYQILFTSKSYKFLRLGM